MPTVPSTAGDAGESLLIHRIRERAGAAGPGIAIGIGDDAAVIEPVRGRSDVLTTDSLVEGVHFNRAWTSAHAIGRKAVLVNLSDLAAMGAVPRALLLSLCVPAALPLADFDALIDGVLLEAGAARAALVGGNITSSPGPLVVGVTAMGAVHPRRVLRRDGGRPGHELYVTGSIGAAAAGLDILRTGAGRATLAPGPAWCVDRYETPPLRVAMGRLVGGYRAASACVDLSDGLADAVHQIAQASGTGARLQAEALPIDEAAVAWWTAALADPIGAALSGGEDYELLFAVPPRKRRWFLGAAAKAGALRVTRIGSLTTGGDCEITRGESTSPLPGGFRHFEPK